MSFKSLRLFIANIKWIPYIALVSLFFTFLMFWFAGTTLKIPFFFLVAILEYCYFQAIPKLFLLRI